MARFELSIYGDDDEVLKKYETDHIRWGTFLQAVKLNEEIKGKPADEQFKAINQFVKNIFRGLTDEDLDRADGMDVINTFNQLLKAFESQFNGGGSKNA